MTSPSCNGALTSRCYTLPDLTGSVAAKTGAANGLSGQGRISMLVTPQQFRNTGASNLSKTSNIPSGSCSRISRPMSTHDAAPRFGFQGAAKSQINCSAGNSSYIDLRDAKQQNNNCSGTNSYIDLREANNELFSRLKERRLQLEKLEGIHSKKKLSSGSKIPDVGSTKVSKIGSRNTLNNHAPGLNSACDVGARESNGNISNNTTRNERVAVGSIPEGDAEIPDDGNPWVRHNPVKTTTLGLKRPYQASESDVTALTRDKPPRDVAPRKSLSRDQLPRYQQQSRDQLSRDQLARNRLSLDKVTHDQLSRNQSSRDQVSQDQLSRDQLARNRLSLDTRYQLSRGQVSQDQQSRDQLSHNRLSLDKISHDELSRDKLSRDQLSGNRVSLDKVSRDQLSRVQLSRDQVSRDVRGSRGSAGGLRELSAEEQERLRRQAQQLVRGFDAMAVLIQYLTNREDLSFQSLCKQLSSRKSQLHSSHQQLTDVISQNQALNADLRTARQLANQVNSRNEELIQSNRKLQSEVKDLGRFRTSFVSDLGKLDSRLKDLTDKNDQLTNENERLADQLMEAERERNDVIVQLNDVTLKRKKALEEIRQQRDDTSKQNEELARNVRDLKIERDRLKKERDTVRQTKEETMSHVDDVIKERDDVIKQRDEALSRNAELQTRVMNVANENKDILTEKEKLEKDLKKSTAANELLKKENLHQEQLRLNAAERVKVLEEQLQETRLRISSEENKFRQMLNSERLEFERKIQAEKEISEKKLQSEREKFNKQLDSQKAQFETQLKSGGSPNSKRIEFEKRLQNEKVDKGERLKTNLEEESAKKIKELTAEHQLVVNNLKTAHQTELSSLKQELSDLSKTYQTQLNDLRKEHSRTVNEMNKAKEKSEKHFTEVLKRHQSETDSKLAEKNREYEKIIQNMSKSYKMSSNRASGSSVDSGMSDSPRGRGESDGGDDAYLKQEVESLRTVLDMRTEELHRLRKCADDMAKKLEEIPVLKDTIEKQKQSLENLDAVLSLKSDFERELSEKHQGLLRKADRDSKALKRLSMDKEELVWKLNQSEACIKAGGSRQSLEQLSPGVDAVGSNPDVFSNTASMDCLSDGLNNRSPGSRNGQSKPQRPKSMVVLGSKSSNSRSPFESTSKSSGKDVQVSMRSTGTVSSRKAFRPSSAACSTSVNTLPAMESLVEQRHIEDIAEMRQSDV